MQPVLFFKVGMQVHVHAEHTLFVCDLRAHTCSGVQ